MALKLLFLGDRRIAQVAWHCLVHNFSKHIEITGVVTNPEFFRDIVQDDTLSFVDNRHSNNEKILELLERDRADVLISFQHPWKLPKEVLEVVSYRALNFHNAPLPGYKGYNSINHAISNGDQAFSSTIHWMTDEIDRGDVAFEFPSVIDHQTTAVSLYKQTVENASRGLDRVLRALLERNVPRSPMDHGGGLFYPKSSINTLRDVTAVEDPLVLDRRIRACFFPGYEPAFRTTDYGKQYLLPSTAMEYVGFYERPFNMHSGSKSVGECYGQV